MAPARSLAGLALAAAVAAATAGCTTDEDCNLGGTCDAGGTCNCVPPWTGTNCGLLDFLPARAPDGALYRRANVSSWCASTMRDDATGLWHAVVAQMAGNCGLNSWETNSQLIHLVSESGPEGPFVNETLIRLPFSHNPKLARAPDGTWQVWHIGCGDDTPVPMGPCSGGVSPLPPPPPPVRLTNAGACMAPVNTSFPCFTSPQGFEVCPLVLSSDPAVCASNLSAWSVEGTSYVNAAVATADVNVDCDSCAAGAILKMFADGKGQGGRTLGGASGLVFNASTGQLMVAGCSGVCVSNGVAGASAPCSHGGEPWFSTQLHLVPCNSSASLGWASAPVTARPEPAAPGTNCGISYTELLTASSPDGPWTFQTAFGPNNTVNPYFPVSVDNPAPLYFPNGSIGVMFRSYTRESAQFHSSIGIARADDWRGPWTLPTEPIFAGLEEDPFWWKDAAGNFHGLYHDMGGCSNVGCHAFSRDGWNWTLSATPAYDFSVTFTDGSTTVFSRRERPQLVFDPVTGVPTHLINGVQLPRAQQPSGPNQHDYTYSIIVPLRTP